MEKNVEKYTWHERYCTEEMMTKRIKDLARRYRQRRGFHYSEEDLIQEGWMGALKFLNRHPGEYYKAANHARAAMQLFCRVNGSIVGAYKTTEGIEAWQKGMKICTEVPMPMYGGAVTGNKRYDTTHYDKGSARHNPEAIPVQLQFTANTPNPEEWLLLTEAAVAFEKAVEKVGEENLPHFDRPGPRFSCKRMRDVSFAMKREMGDVWIEGLVD